MADEPPLLRGASRGALIRGLSVRGAGRSRTIGGLIRSGASFRLTGATPFPTNMGVGATGSDLDAYEMGRITALEGRALGIHMTYAPVVDVNINPDNPIINTRSVGADPALVSRIAKAFIRGVQSNGMLATAKRACEEHPKDAWFICPPAKE